jgi:hypothetical protein
VPYQPDARRDLVGLEQPCPQLLERYGGCRAGRERPLAGVSSSVQSHVPRALVERLSGPMRPDVAMSRQMPTIDRAVFSSGCFALAIWC